VAAQRHDRLMREAQDHPAPNARVHALESERLGGKTLLVGAFTDV
jgi:hypothetical protein